MSAVFTVACYGTGARVTSYFTTDRRRARRFARRTGLRFRVDREGRRTYGGGVSLGVGLVS